MKFASPKRIEGTAMFGMRLAQMYAARVCGGKGPCCPHRFTPEPGSDCTNEARNCVSGKAIARKSSNMAVPPAAKPTGLPKNNEPAMVARLAVCPARAAVELASGL